MMISSSTQTTGKMVPGNTEFERVPVRPHCGSMEIIDMVILKSFLGNVCPAFTILPLIVVSSIK